MDVSYLVRHHFAALNSAIWRFDSDVLHSGVA
jgi:hypothetical protein